MSEETFVLEKPKSDHFIVVMTAAVLEVLSESALIKQTLTEMFSLLFNNLQGNFGQHRFSAKLHKRKVKGNEFAYLLVTSV